MVKQENIREFCGWYLTNVNSTAKTITMTVYATENGSIPYSKSLTTSRMSAALSACQDFKSHNGYWCLNENLC